MSEENHNELLNKYHTQGEENMRTIKSYITRLKTSINGKLPSENDIFGYSGINKDSIFKSLDETYAFLDELERQKETFEVVVLKRTIAKLTKDCLRYLDQENLNQDNFDYFLNIITDIKFHTRQTYFLVIEDSIRDEEEISKLRSERFNLQQEIEEYKKVVEQFIEQKDQVEKAYSSIMDIDEKVRDHDIKTKELLDDAEVNTESISVCFKSADQEYKNIETIKKHIKELETTCEQKMEIINKLESNITTLDDKISEIDNEINLRNEKMIEQQNTIRDIIDDASRSSMAGSFRTRKIELDEPVRRAEKLMNWSLIAVTVIAALLILPDLISFSDLRIKDSFDYSKTLIKLPILFPLVWIAWSNSKKYGFLSRIREDYAFKYAAAMAFEGYKKHASEYSDLEEQLLIVSIANMGNNPIRLYDTKTNHASPFNEMIESAKEFIKEIGLLKGKESEKVSDEQ